MLDNVVALKNFYESRLGKMSCQRLRAKINNYWEHPTKESILGYGFALPYLPLFTYGNNCLAFCPQNMGAMQMVEYISTVMVDETLWPAKNEQFDKVLLIHALENSEYTEKLLEQCWRVLKPGGRLILIAANENSLWQNFKTPFSKVKSFSIFKLREHLMFANFIPRRITRSLFFFPTNWTAFNKIIEFFCSVFIRWKSAVIIVEAEKVVFAPRGRVIKAPTNFWDRIFKPKGVEAGV